MFDFHRNEFRSLKCHNDYQHKVPSVNPTFHPYEVCKGVPVKSMGSNCGKIREMNGASSALW